MIDKEGMKHKTEKYRVPGFSILQVCEAMLVSKNQADRIVIECRRELWQCGFGCTILCFLGIYNSLAKY